VESVELRALRTDHDPGEVRQMMERVWDEGFLLTVHGSVKSRESCVSDIFEPLAQAFPLRQKALNITFHPIAGDNATVLCALADHAAEQGLPVRFSLENNRLLPDNTEGDSVALVLDAVKRANRENVGICFDMGHYGYYIKKNHPETPDMLPPPAFFKRVVHTHIHALNGMRTHFPLDEFELNLSTLLKALARGYFGVYNIELDFPRFAELREPISGLLGSVKALREAMPLHAKLYEDIRFNYDREFMNALSVFRGENQGTRVSLTQSSSYLFNTNGFLWGMDISFRTMWKLSKATAHIQDLLKPLKLMVITHEHADHFERATVRVLAKNEDMHWVIPDFLVDRALEYGVRRDRIIAARPGESIVFGPLTILPFEGRHLRPVTHDGVPALGYYISAENGPTMAFPGDVRDYSLNGLPQLPDADYCFAHVWMGDGNCLNESFDPLDKALAAFMLHFSTKNILIGHLYDIGRPENYMWQRHHGQIVAQRICEQSPKTKIRIPRRGEVILLG